MEPPAVAFLRQTEEKQEALQEPLRLAEAALSKALEEVERCRKKIEPISSRIDALDFDVLVCEWIPALIKGAPIVLSDTEAKRLVEICTALFVETKLYPAYRKTRLSSRHTVSKDCGVKEVGWDELDEEANWDLILDIKENEWAPALEYEECIVSPSLKDIETKDLKWKKDKIEYDGDHHGVWAYVRAKHRVTVVCTRARPKDATPDLYVYFVDAPIFDGTPDKKAVFSTELDFDEEKHQYLDVSFLDGYGRKPARYEGILVPADKTGYLRFAKEREVKDYGPGNSDKFWYWEELANDFAEWKAAKKT